MATQRQTNYTEFVRSFSNELVAIKDRVRHLIGVGHHNAEEGRYKEIVLAEILRSALPENIGVGTGFVLCDDREISSQIDIILYDKSKSAEVLKKGNFVIVLKQSVLGIIEVKTTLKSSEMEGVIDKLCEEKAKISPKIFAGLFGYHYENELAEYEISLSENQMQDSIMTSKQSDDKFAHFSRNFKEILERNFYEKKQIIDCIACGRNYFMKFWEKYKPVKDENPYEHYSFYGIRNLSFGYFISNLKEHIRLLTTKTKISKQEYALLYPIDKGKEHCRKTDLEIEFKE